MITLTGFDAPSFHFLLNLFAPVYEHYLPYVNKDGYIVRKKPDKGMTKDVEPNGLSGSCSGLESYKGVINGVAAVVWDDNVACGEVFAVC